jgi:hypothetical protein
VLTLGLIVPTGSSPAAKAGYRGNDPLPADIEGANMRLAADHRRLLGNGRCTRPVTLDCAFETICERCGFFETGLEFVPVLLRNATTPPNTTSPTAPNSSPTSSTASTPTPEHGSIGPDPGSPDHPCNNAGRAGTAQGRPSGLAV